VTHADAGSDDHQLALAPLGEEVEHVRGSPAGRRITEYGDYGRIFTALLRKRGLEPVPVPADTD
jgi:hypothetical protein